MGVVGAALPPPGSHAAGWVAAIRHPTSLTDGQAELLVMSPVGRTRLVGEVSDNAVLDDVVPDVRWIITSRVMGPEERPLRRIAVWNTLSRRASLVTLPLAAEDRIFLVRNGFLVRERINYRVQLRSLTGSLERVYLPLPGASGPPVVLRSGTRFAQPVGDRLVVRDVLSGAVVDEDFHVPEVTPRYTLRFAPDDPSGLGDLVERERVLLRGVAQARETPAW